MHVDALAQAAAAEAENAIDQHFGTPGRVHHVVNVAPQGAALDGVFLCKLAIPQNRPEYVVKIVCDAACEGADRLHLLRLPQLCLQMLLVGLYLFLSGHIEGRTDEAIRLARPLPKAAASREQPVPVAVTVLDAVFAFEARRAALEVIVGCCVQTRPVLGVNENSCVPCCTRSSQLVFALTFEN